MKLLASQLLVTRWIETKPEIGKYKDAFMILNTEESSIQHLTLNLKDHTFCVNA